MKRLSEAMREHGVRLDRRGNDVTVYKNDVVDSTFFETHDLEYLGRLIECLKRLVPGEWVLDLSPEDAMNLWQNVPIGLQAELRNLRPKDAPPGFMFFYCGVDIVQGERGVEGTEVAEVGTPTLFAVELDDADMRALRPVLAKYGFAACENRKAFMHKAATVVVNGAKSSILDARMSIQIEALPIRR